MQHRFDYNTKMHLKEKRRSACLVSDLFPQLSSAVIHVTHYHEPMVEPLRLERTINILPASCTNFSILCLSPRCEGIFDLLPVISDMIENTRRVAKGKLKCCGNETVPAGHAWIIYEISLKFKQRIVTHVN